MMRLKYVKGRNHHMIDRETNIPVGQIRYHSIERGWGFRLLPHGPYKYGFETLEAAGRELATTYYDARRAFEPL